MKFRRRHAPALMLGQIKLGMGEEYVARLPITSLVFSNGVLMYTGAELIPTPGFDWEWLEIIGVDGQQVGGRYQQPEVVTTEAGSSINLVGRIEFNA